ncbi:hypothetical protein D6D25_08246 [Aureobasidium pullulans]|nr:hypothetical protein D6D25_08246 [Aureobasidium pullulans]
MAPVVVSHVARAATRTLTPCAGCLDPSKVNNKIYFSLFAIIGAAIVVASIWFFFHAKNGGFHWQQGDWDDYKSTVLRKKDANGNTIYSARSTIMPPSKGDRIAAKSVVGYDEKGRKGIMAVRGFGGSHSVYYSDSFTQYTGGDRSDAMTSISRNEKRPAKMQIRGGHAPSATTDHSRRYRDRDLRDYKHEKPARVGGMNRSADGTTYDFSDRSETMTEASSAAPILSSSDRKREKAEKRAAEDAARMERKWRKEAERAAAALAREQASPSSPKKPSTPKISSSPKVASSPEKVVRSSKRGASRSRSSSPKKSQPPRQRDYSFSGAPDEISTQYTGTSYTATTTNRTNSSYYDAYRPLAQASPQQQSTSEQRRDQRRSERRQSSSRNNSASPSKQHRSSRYTYTDSEAASSDRSGRYERVRGGEGRSGEKKKSKGRDVMAGYRRGMDSLGSDSE